MEQVTLFLQQLLNGLSLGSIYALIALGYTMVYGVLRFINFAHGDVYMLGAFPGSSPLSTWQSFFLSRSTIRLPCKIFSALSAARAW